VGVKELCAEEGEKLSGGRYSVVCREKGRIERSAIVFYAERREFCVLRDGKN